MSTWRGKGSTAKHEDFVEGVNEVEGDGIDPELASTISPDDSRVSSKVEAEAWT